MGTPEGTGSVQVTVRGRGGHSPRGSGRAGRIQGHLYLQPLESTKALSQKSFSTLAQVLQVGGNGGSWCQRTQTAGQASEGWRKSRPSRTRLEASISSSLQPLGLYFLARDTAPGSKKARVLAAQTDKPAMAAARVQCRHQARPLLVCSPASLPGPVGRCGPSSSSPHLPRP